MLPWCAVVRNVVESGLRFNDAIDVSLVSYEALSHSGLVNSVIETSRYYSSGDLPAATAATNDPYSFTICSRCFENKHENDRTECRAQSLRRGDSSWCTTSQLCTTDLSGPDGMSASVGDRERLRPDLGPPAFGQISLTLPRLDKEASSASIPATVGGVVLESRE
jgi:hypothetical protein